LAGKMAILKCIESFQLLLAFFESRDAFVTSRGALVTGEMLFLIRKN
jgi:hypothetical protein